MAKKRLDDFDINPKLEGIRLEQPLFYPTNLNHQIRGMVLIKYE